MNSAGTPDPDAARNRGGQHATGITHRDLTPGNVLISPATASSSSPTSASPGTPPSTPSPAPGSSPGSPANLARRSPAAPPPARPPTPGAWAAPCTPASRAAHRSRRAPRSTPSPPPSTTRAAASTRRRARSRHLRSAGEITQPADDDQPGPHPPTRVADDPSGTRTAPLPPRRTDHRAATPRARTSNPSPPHHLTPDRNRGGGQPTATRVASRYPTDHRAHRCTRAKPGETVKGLLTGLLARISGNCPSQRPAPVRRAVCVSSIALFRGSGQCRTPVTPSPRGSQPTGRPGGEQQ